MELLVADAKKQFNFEGDNNPDLHVLSFEKFLIEDASDLARSAQLKSVSGRSLFILGIASINTHAQQALLKLFEEPQEGIIFVLLVPPGILLPTLRSRLMVYPGNLLAGGQDSLVSTRGLFERQAANFLKAPYKTRSTQITALLKDEDNTRERVRGFLNALESELYAQFAQSSTKEKREALEDISKIRSYLSDQSPSLKMLLEHLAATLPVI